MLVFASAWHVRGARVDRAAANFHAIESKSKHFGLERADGFGYVALAFEVPQNPVADFAGVAFPSDVMDADIAHVGAIGFSENAEAEDFEPLPLSESHLDVLRFVFDGPDGVRPREKFLKPRAVFRYVREHGGGLL